MADQDAGQMNEPRPATAADLLGLCSELNRSGAKYMVVGGWAMIHHGYGRTTQDIDLLVDTSAENFERIKAAMLKLPDGAIREVAPGDLDEFVVVRVGDEFVIDLMKRACGIEYAEASKEVVKTTVNGVAVPLPSPKLLWRMKQTRRAKDASDLLFLEELLRKAPLQ